MDTSRKNGANRAWAEGAPAGGNSLWEFQLAVEHWKSTCSISRLPTKDGQNTGRWINMDGQVLAPKNCFVSLGQVLRWIEPQLDVQITSNHRTTPSNVPKIMVVDGQTLGFPLHSENGIWIQIHPHIGHSFPSVLGASRHFDGRGAPRWHGFKGWLGYDLHMYTYINHSTYSYTCIHTYIRTCMDACILPYMHSFHTDTHTFTSLLIYIYII